MSIFCLSKYTLADGHFTGEFKTIAKCYSLISLLYMEYLVMYIIDRAES